MTQKSYTNKKKYAIEFQFLTKFYSIYKPKNIYNHYDIENKRCILKITDTYVFPIGFNVYTYREYTPKLCKYSEKEATNTLNTKLNEYIKELEEKGVEIIENNVKIDSSSDKLSMSGFLLVNEKIGVLSDIHYEAEEKETEGE